MRHLCILLHGIECDPTQRIWNEELAIQLYPWAGGRIEFQPRKYGYVSGARAWWNWGSVATGRSFLEETVDHEEAYFKLLREDVGQDTRISIIAHSLGGYIVHELLKRGMKFHNIISLYAAAPENQDWSEIETRFNNYYIFWSPNDEVLSNSNFGRIGLVGPQQVHHKVFSVQTNERHNDFMENYTEKGYEQIWVNMLEAA